MLIFSLAYQFNVYFLSSSLFFPFLISAMPSSSSAVCNGVEVSAVSNDDILVISEDKWEAPHNHSLFESGGREVAVQLLNVSQYNHEEICLNLDQRVDSSYPLLDIR